MQIKGIVFENNKSEALFIIRNDSELWTGKSSQ